MIDSIFLSATNHLLAQSGWARMRLQPHAGKRARLDIAPVSIAFSVSSDGHLASCSSDEEPDVCLQLPLSETSRALTGGIEALMSKVRISGNAEFADALGFVFRHLRWDLEEDLSHMIGDIAAHRVVNTGIALGAAQKRLATNLSGNLVEYLTEEVPMLTTRAMLPRFDEDIRALRDAVARLEKRVDRLAPAGKR
ncbi:SCP2 sterol-binding domain-containing protein [Azoarcus sp. L1K30]|uniref:ubiquinone biosynthesis accessory factor UbiJ n=1 Tax=Azoarcus sp. L1K30 TaxID=2820277 RepID=UPI001B824B0D|nr:SCP2 sterol-binding domain-containing protein [Azoarcus sp. L1K30]MBR0567366.1 SCP2 sterol-binding domain-containing protein [Azoarcus sp. L1K30]